jgi:hypothetical protein
MRRLVVVLLSALVAIVSACLLLVARKQEAVQALIDRLPDPDWTGLISPDSTEIGEVMA